MEPPHHKARQAARFKEALQSHLAIRSSRCLRSPHLQTVLGGSLRSLSSQVRTRSVQCACLGLSSCCPATRLPCRHDADALLPMSIGRHAHAKQKHTLACARVCAHTHTHTHNSLSSHATCIAIAPLDTASPVGLEYGTDHQLGRLGGCAHPRGVHVARRQLHRPNDMARGRASAWWVWPSICVPS
jgi:hypothetical protein